MNAYARLQTARAEATRLAALLGSEHSAMADFILALADFDAARGWAELGHPSLFSFLQRQLHLSNGAAFHRSAAARLVQRFPSVAVALRAGRLCLSSTAELAKVLTPENEGQVLPRFFGLSAREAKDLVAELDPRPSPPTREVVTAIAPASEVESLRTSEVDAPPTGREQGASPLGAPSSDALAAPAPEETATASRPEQAVGLPGARLDAPPSRPADEAVPLTADLRRLHVTVSRRFLQKLEAAREARSHARPDATTGEILEEALDLLLAREAKRRTAATERPRSVPRPASEVHIPAHVRREVWARDQGRCTWPLDGGGTCGSTHRLQLDHTLAAARGGPPTAANLRILCEAHNKEAARRTFGARWMARFDEGGARRAG